MIDAKRQCCRWGLGLLICVVVAVSCRSTPEPKGEPKPPIDSAADDPDEAVSAIDGGAESQAPSRIILFIGDGMGLPAVAAASYVDGVPLSMLGMEEFGIMATHEYEFVTTDSAASATAMATGKKSHFNAVSVTPSTGPDEEHKPDRQLRTMVDAAQDAGWKTGLVATSRINHATPAPFAAHRHHRQAYDDLALDISEAGVDVLMGAGTDFFVDRDDGRDLFGEMEQRGYAIATDADQVRQSAQRASKLVGLMHERDMPWADTGERAMELDEMVEHTLEVLDRDNEEGFFLMVEGSFIDWAGHAMNGERVVSETLDMDRAVERALEYARQRDDTLVVVTSDHETGAMDIIDGPTADRYTEVSGGETELFERTLPAEIDDEVRDVLSPPWAHFEYGRDAEFGPSEAVDRRLTTTFGYFSAASRAHWELESRFSAIHTPHFVPLFAEGPKARQVAAMRDNADLGRRLVGWIDGEKPEVQGGDVESPAGTQSPKNVVLVVGSGFGIASLTAHYYHFGQPAWFEMSRMAAVATHGVDRLVNDAAGTATALASGVRTRRGAIGMAPGLDGGDLQPVASVFDRAAEAGKSTGLVTTSSLTNPTPASFFATRSETGDDEDIADQLVDRLRTSEADSGLQFVAGGGESIGDDARAGLRGQGYHFTEQWDEVDGKQSTIYAPGVREIGDAQKRWEDNKWPTLGELTGRALQSLDRDDNGFFLMVEAGGIDTAKRDLDRRQRLLAEVRDFEVAVQEAVDFAEHDGQTLVIATSDRDHTLSVFDNHYGFHRGRCAALVDCGGDFETWWFDVATDRIRHGAGLDDRAVQGEFGPPRIGLQYTWLVQQAARHRAVEGAESANFVPLFAHGPGALHFGGFMHQADVGQWLADWTAESTADEP